MSIVREEGASSVHRLFLTEVVSRMGLILSSQKGSPCAKSDDDHRRSEMDR
jgi:hypothetical protein